LKEQYAAAMVAEIEQVAGDVKRPSHTIFFGGGTPTLMPPTTLQPILHAVRSHFNLTSNAEVTMEANPGTVDLNYLRAVQELGVNRLSFGVQSVIPSELALLEREHDFAAVVQAVEMSHQAGINNINLDLIYGVPGQTLASWEESVRTALTLQPQHLSLYCLTIEPGTPMNRWLQNGRIQPPDPDLAADQYELAGNILAEHQFEHYEISNWAQPGYACEHNLTYWRNGEYLGFGAGAHGHAAGYRYQIVKQPRVYMRRLLEGTEQHFPLSTAVSASHAIDKQENMSDVIITQLRLLQEGLDLDAFVHQFGQTLNDAYDGTMSQMIEWELLKIEDNYLKLTENGRFVSNQVFYRFM